MKAANNSVASLKITLANAPTMDSLGKKDSIIKEKDMELDKRDVIIKGEEEEISKKDTIIIEKDVELVSSKAKIASKDLIINNLNSSITQLQHSLKEHKVDNNFLISMNEKFWEQNF